MKYYTYIHRKKDSQEIFFSSGEEFRVSQINPRDSLQKHDQGQREEVSRQQTSNLRW